MRHVFSSHNEVAHVWANDHKRVGHGSGKNVYFSGSTIYSYGSHFPIARFVEVKGRSFVLFTTRSYSVSTAKHISIVRRALGYRDTIDVRDPSSSDWKGMVKELLTEAGQLKEQAARRRCDYRRSADLAAAEKKMNDARFLAGIAGMRLPKSDEEAFAKLQRDAAKAARKARKEAEERRKAEAARKARLEELWEAAKPYWRDRAPIPADIMGAAAELGVYNVASAHGFSVAMRLTPDGSEIETSWGARFPTEHGIRAFRVLKMAWSRMGEDEAVVTSVNSPGPRLGHYRIDRIDPNGVKAGCHYVSRAEIELMAERLNVKDIEPATPDVA